MGVGQLRIVGLTLAAVVVFVSGFWLTRAGKPYGPVLFNIHKLIAVATVIVMGVMVFQANRVAPLSVPEWTTVVITGLLAIALFISGGLMNTIEAVPPWILWFHRLASFPVAVLAAVSVRFTLSRG